MEDAFSDPAMEGLMGIERALASSAGCLQQLEQRQQAANAGGASQATFEQIFSLRQGFYAAIDGAIAQLHHVGGLILVVRLGEWELEKLRGGITEAQAEIGIASLLEWCERLFACLAETHGQLARARTEPADQPYTELAGLIGSLTKELVIRSTIFKKQPPSILKTNIKCDVEITCLGGKHLGFASSVPPAVSLCLINESQARTILDAIEHGGHAAAGAAIGQPSGELVNREQHMLFDQSSSSYVAFFRSLALKKVTRTQAKAKKAELAVTEEKFAIAFQTTLQCGSMDVTVVKFSQPLVSIVHGNQMPNARATAFWDMSFSDQQRVPWEVPASVRWSLLAPALGSAFGRLTGQPPLPSSALDYLSTKLCVGTENVAWHNFAKAPMPNRSFTFWDWFYSIVELVSKHMSGPWADGLIAGFVNKTEVERVLLSHNDGTFLLRFSDSAVGGITVSWVGRDQLGLRQVWNLEPWTAKDFAIRSLADRISDLGQLQHVYPSIPKMKAFGKYCTVTINSGLSGDYVPTKIAAVMPTPDVLTFGHPDPAGLSGGPYDFESMDASGLQGMDSPRFDAFGNIGSTDSFGLSGMLRPMEGFFANHFNAEQGDDNPPSSQ